MKEIEQRTIKEQEQIRRESLARLQSLGLDPYKHLEFHVNTTIEEVITKCKDDPMACTDISIAGRVMQKRIMGNAAFIELQDSTGRLQLYISKNDLSKEGDIELYQEVFKKLLDIGDIIGIKGFSFLTKTGQLTAHVKNLQILSKALRPFPVVKIDNQGLAHDAFNEPEARHRMRYVDYTVNPDRKKIVKIRAQLLTALRTFFNSYNWIEIDTPILQPIHGGAAARPFQTFHNDLGINLFLRIANELYLKRMIVAGFDGVYEIGKMFRNEGIDKTHNPEFTSVELYVAYHDYIWMMEIVEKLLEYITLHIHKTSVVTINGKQIDFKGPYKKISMLDAIKQYTDIDVSNLTTPELQTVCKKLKIEIDTKYSSAKLIDLIFSKYVEPHLIEPTFIIDHPIETTPLAKKHRDNTKLAERFELFINKKEIANAYSELNDPIDQRERFMQQAELNAKGDDEAMQLDEDFIKALEYGMPPTAGLGIGIDRLLMLMTDEESIQEVLLFPQMRPKK